MTEGLAWVLPALTFLAGMGDGADPTAKAPTPETFQAAPRKMQIFSLFPSGAERGTSVEVEVLGANLDGLRRVESSCPGVSMDVISSSYLAARVRFRIARDASASDASDASSGQCRIRMFSALGASNLQVFRIGELPEAVEREPNDSPETAQHLHLPCVVDGRLYPDEDVDFYLIEGKAGEQVTARVRAGSNGSGLNPEIYLLNEAGLRLAVGVNEEGSDPVLRYRFEAQGNYRLAVRGTFGALIISFPTGHPAYVYQLWVADSVPEIRYAQPFTVDADATSAVHVTGQDLSSVDSLMFSDPGMKATIVERAPDQLVAQIHAGGPGVRQMWAMAGPVRSSAVNLLVTAKPDRSGTAPHHTPEQALELNLAEAATGRIARAGDADYYAFKAPEAGLYVWELQAGKFASMLDPKVELLDETGKVLQSGDGAPDSDVKLERKLKGDEKICVKVSQSVLNYAGPGYNYRLLARTAQPTFTLTAGSKQPSPKYLAGADRIYAQRGNSVAVPVKIQWKEGFEDARAPVHIEVDGLPEGVSTEPLSIGPEDGKREKENSPLIAEKDLIFHVKPNAPLTSVPIRIHGEALWAGGDLIVQESVRVNAVGTYVLSMSGGSPQQIDRRYLNVIEPVNYELRPEIGDERYPTRYTVRPGSVKPLLITVLSEAKDLPEMEFDAENLPRGVRIAGVEAVPEKQQYRLSIEASPDAERGWRPMLILVAHLKQGHGILTTPYFGMAVQ